MRPIPCFLLHIIHRFHSFYASSYHGQTPLHVLANEGTKSAMVICRALLSAKADLEAKDRQYFLLPHSLHLNSNASACSFHPCTLHRLCSFESTVTEGPHLIRQHVILICQPLKPFCQRKLIWRRKTGNTFCFRIRRT